MSEAIATFFGDDEFPVTFEDGQRDLLWVHDDLHIPNPVSPMYADIGGWWLKCDYMFRRFGTPFASDWIAKIINGYVYTAAIPAATGLSAEASEYGARYTPRTPLDDTYAAEIGGYLGWTLPYYAENFLHWWRDRLVPEMKRNFDRFDGYDYDGASLVELAVLLEDAIDMHDRHWSIHWVLNFAQFSSTMNLNATVAEVRGEGDHSALLGRLQSSTVNRNWDSIEELWNIKEKIKTDPGGEVAKAFAGATAADVVSALEQTEAGRAFLAQDVENYSQEFGYKSMFAHEFSFRSWREDPAPILEAIRGYLEADYDYPAEIAAVAKDLEAAKAEVMEGVEGEQRDKLTGALDLSLRMNPLTPDHHFYIDQGTNARVRIVLIAIGAKLVADGKLGDPEDVMYLRYNELRTLMAGSNGFDAEDLVGDRRDDRETAYELRPRDWVGTATEENVAFPYLSLWAFPEKLYRKPSTTEGEVHGLGASVGVIEGTARVVLSPEQFSQVERDEIVICRMTSPAWVVLFTKISGLVTDAGGMASHPAVVSREFGIPAVVGTSDATRRIKTGDRVRVNGATGVVQVLGVTLARSVMREQIKEVIIQRILEGTYQPGQRVVELQLVQELGVSQAPVREALRDLEAMRFIETEPYRGARVRQVGRRELTETYPVRAALEELAGEMAGPLADDAMLRLLETEIQSMLEAARKKDQHGLLVHDARFHEIIVEGAGNSVLLDAWSGLRIEAYTLVSVVKSQLDLVAIANAHLPILDALRQRDGSLAGKVMREHIEHFGSTLFGDDPDE